MMNLSHFLCITYRIFHFHIVMSRFESESFSNGKLDIIFAKYPLNFIQANLKQVYLVIANHIIRKRVNLRESLSRDKNSTPPLIITREI